MAIYHLSVKAISRSTGRSATGAAAYRAGEALTDQRTGQVHDYTRKGGVEHTEIVLPTGTGWQPSRSELWNAAELAEKRKDACVAREYEVALPAELLPAERRRLVAEFARDLADREGCAVDIAIHAPGRGGDHRNHHAHLLRTTRKAGATGLGEKLDSEKAGRRRKDDLESLRARWAEFTNRALERAGLDTRIDHRTLAAQGIERVPTEHQGPALTGLARRGETGRVTARRAEEAEARNFAGREVARIERDLAEVQQQIEAERADFAEPPVGTRAAFLRDLNAAVLAQWTERYASRAAGPERPPERERSGPAIQAARFRVTDNKLSEPGQAIPASPLASNPTQPGRPPESAQNRHPLQQEGETLDRTGWRLRAAFIEAERDAWREQEAARYRETAAAHAARRDALQRKRPWFGRDGWAREVAEAERLAGVHEIRARDSLKGEWDHHSDLRPQWEAAADRRLNRDYPELRVAMNEAMARQQAERLVQMLERQGDRKGRIRPRQG